jgi:hypothetical protein
MTNEDALAHPSRIAALRCRCARDRQVYDPIRQGIWPTHPRRPAGSPGLSLSLQSQRQAGCASLVQPTDPSQARRFRAQTRAHAPAARGRRGQGSGDCISWYHGRPRSVKPDAGPKRWRFLPPLKREGPHASRRAMVRLATRHGLHISTMVVYPPRAIRDQPPTKTTMQEQEAEGRGCSACGVLPRGPR